MRHTADFPSDAGFARCNSPGLVLLLLFEFSRMARMHRRFRFDMLIGCALTDLLPLQFVHIDDDGAAAAAHCFCQFSVGNPHLPSSAVCVQAKIDEEPEGPIGKHSESARNFPSRGKPSAGALPLSGRGGHREPACASRRISSRSRFSVPSARACLSLTGRQSGSSQFAPAATFVCHGNG